MYLLYHLELDRYSIKSFLCSSLFSIDFSSSIGLKSIVDQLIDKVIVGLSRSRLPYVVTYMKMSGTISAFYI